MRFMDELKRLAKPFSEDSEDFDNYDDGLNDEAPNVPPASKASVAPAYDMNDLGLGSATATVNNDNRSNKVVSIHPTVQMQVILVKPESRRFEGRADARHSQQKNPLDFRMIAF